VLSAASTRMRDLSSRFSVGFSFTAGTSTIQWLIAY
jgi:hypothetical protein